MVVEEMTVVAVAVAQMVGEAVVAVLKAMTVARHTCVDLQKRHVKPAGSICSYEPSSDSPSSLSECVSCKSSLKSGLLKKF